MEFSYRTWWSVTVVIMLSSLMKSARGQGVKCWRCPIDKDSDTCRTMDERYIPEVAVVDTFCDDLRSVPQLVAQLCDWYPAGYKVVCHRTVPTLAVEICSSAYCPVEGKSSHQRGNNAISQHAPSVFFVMAAAAVISVTRVLL